VSVKAYKNHKKTIEEISKEQKILNIIDQRYNYNEDGTLKNAYTGNMLYEYSFNDEGMLESKSASGRTLLSYDYDKNNNIKTIKDITGKSSIYNYDAANRVKEIKDNNENTVVNYDYFKNDNIKNINYGNGLKSNYSYDGDGNVESLVTVTSTGEVLVDYSYAYDLNGNRIEKISSKHKNNYIYDSMNRLKDSSYDGRQESFTYDKVGNRLTKTTNDIIDKYVYNVKNQLKELHQDSGTNFFTYDKQGNTIKEETQVGNNSYEYNNLNQQVKALTKEGNTLVSRYDTEGLRCEIEENEKLTKFIFHKENVLVETDKDFNAISRFTRGYEVVAANIVDGDLGSNRCYYIHDEQGSTVFITDKEQQIKNEYCYDAFGNVLESTEDVHNRITYTGQQFDGITNQYYLRARFYNPVIGRFTQEDVYRGDGLNLYSYCGSNPVLYFDPSGYMDCKIKENSWNTYQKEHKGEPSSTKGRADVYNKENDKAPVSKNNAHGNCKDSTNPNHVYVIVDDDTGEMMKVGISGQQIQQNGTSPRSNPQVAALNIQNGTERYRATIIEQNLTREEALNLEQMITDKHAARNSGNMPSEIHKRPLPQVENIKEFDELYGIPHNKSLGGRY
ncbi:RHS repeat-associated core domain-containing protein, partial [Clostridium estertheticum]|uniref:RHS repeat-associated core domain-containing protein n=1 Tax=Clostridium estertheticum TaxID=238834 RepID=UPI00299DD3F0